MKFGSLCLALAGTASAFVAGSGIARQQHEAASLEARASPDAYPANIFKQKIDHFPSSDRYRPHSNATFSQRYYFDSSYYKPGGPVFLYIGGETSGPSRFSNLQTGIIQILMKEFNGLGVILENRYYGESYPFNLSTTDNLAYLTTEQTIADNAYFAQHATFPGVNATLTAPNTPWILYGGSLAGAQTAFSVVQYGDSVLYGGIASSAVVHAVHAYPQWYDPIQKFGPQDCISRLNAIVDTFDSLLKSKNATAITKFKALFGLESLKDDRDFAMTVAFPIGGPMNYPTNTWQELNWDPAQGSRDFYRFCGNVTAPSASPATDNSFGRPLPGLANYAAYVKKTLLPLCPSGAYDSTACFGTQNASYWSDITSGTMRSYLYSTCTEQGAYQIARKTGPVLLSRVIDESYTQQWCNWAFPKGRYNAIPQQPDLSYYNHYGDLNISHPRLALIDGSSDVWVDVCYHASEAGLRTGPNQYLINGGGHHWDSYGILDVEKEPQFIREAHFWEIRTIRGWLDAFPSWKRGPHYARTEL